MNVRWYLLCAESFVCERDMLISSLLAARAGNGNQESSNRSQEHGHGD